MFINLPFCQLLIAADSLADSKGTCSAGAEHPFVNTASGVPPIDFPVRVPIRVPGVKRAVLQCVRIHPSDDSHDRCRLPGTGISGADPMPIPQPAGPPKTHGIVNPSSFCLEVRRRR